jgi:hypothetical protein
LIWSAWYGEVLKSLSCCMFNFLHCRVSSFLLGWNIFFGSL